MLGRITYPNQPYTVALAALAAGLGYLLLLNRHRPIPANAIRPSGTTA